MFRRFSLAVRCEPFFSPQVTATVIHNVTVFFNGKFILSFLRYPFQCIRLCLTTNVNTLLFDTAFSVEEQSLYRAVRGLVLVSSFFHFSVIHFTASACTYTNADKPYYLFDDTAGKDYCAMNPALANGNGRKARQLRGADQE